MVHVLKVKNVCEALPAGLEYLLKSGKVEETRAGRAYAAPGPVATVTLRPTQRVLTSAVRDANPFFHLYEAIWMLGGRDDAAPLNSFVARFGHEYGEPTGEVHGAYGRRWRSALGTDQLNDVVNILRREKNSRQCVIQMWDCTPHFATHEVLLYPGENDLLGTWRDRPCNTHVYLRVRSAREYVPGSGTTFNGLDERAALEVLDLTVCCRSNDAIWGAHGANAVHFSILQEYLAARIGVGVGVMTQFSNNYHAYETEINRLQKRVVRDYCNGDPEKDTVPAELWLAVLRSDWYVPDHGGWVEPLPMFDAPDGIDSDVDEALAWFDAGAYPDQIPKFQNNWFENTWCRAVGAHVSYRAGSMAGALDKANIIRAADWRVACTQWLSRRHKRAKGTSDEQPGAGGASPEVSCLADDSNTDGG